MFVKSLRKDVRKGARERYDGYTKRPTRVIYTYIYIYINPKNPKLQNLQNMNHGNYINIKVFC